MAIQLKFARSDRTLGVKTTAGGSINLTDAALVPNAASRAAEKAGKAVTSVIEAKLRRDAKTIVADSITRIQEDSSLDFQDASQRTVSSVEGLPQDQSLSSVDTLVNNEEDSDFHNQSFSNYTLGRFDRRAKDEVGKITNGLARRELEVRIASVRNSLAQKSFRFEAQSNMAMRKELVLDSAQRMMTTARSNPFELEGLQADLADFIDGSGIDPSGRMQMKRTLGAQLAQSAANGLIDLDPRIAMQALEENKEYKDKLTDTQFNALKTRAVTRSEQFNEEEKENLTSLLKTDLQSRRDTGQGVPGLLDSIERSTALEDEEKTEMLRQARAANVIHGPLTQINGMNIKEMDSFVKDLKSRPMQEDIKKDVFDAVDKAVFEQKQQALFDPAALVDSLNSEIMDKIPEENLAERFTTRLSFQAQKGIKAENRRGLSNSDRDGMIDSINNSPGERLLPFISEMRSKLDENPEQNILSDKLFDEIRQKVDGLGPLQRMFLDHRDKPVSLDISRVIDQRLKMFDKSPDLAFKKEPDTNTIKKDLINQVEENVSLWAQQGTGDSVFRKHQAEQVTQAATLLAEYYVRQGMFPKVAVNKATNALIGDPSSASKAQNQIKENSKFEGVTATHSDGRKIKMISGMWHVKEGGRWVKFQG